MPPGTGWIEFILYMVVGGVLIFTFLLLCVRISVYIEDTCPISFCLRRKQRKLRKMLIRDMLFPEDRVTDPGSPRPAPPSDENITADIICQPYIYRDAYSTGLTELSGLSYLANLPLTVAMSDGNPSDAVVTRYNSEPIPARRCATLRNPHQALPVNVQCHPAAVSEVNNCSSPTLVEPAAPTQDDNLNATSDTGDDVASEVQSLPPDYLNATNVLNSNDVYQPADTANSNDEAPPPSYYECVRSKYEQEENGNFTNLCT